VLVAIAADKGAPGVTTASLALATVWPRPVLLAECDAAGGDLFYRLPAADGGRLDPQRGLLSLAVAARRGIQPHQVWRHTQKLHGGLDLLAGLVNAEQAAGLHQLWGQIGKVFAEVGDVDVIADCGRLGVDGPFYDLLAHAAAVVLIARVTLEDVVRLRDRAVAVATGLANRGLSAAYLGVVVVADHKHFKRNIAEAGQALAQSGVPARILGGLADEPRSAEMLRGQWGTRLDRSLLIRTARELAANLARDLAAMRKLAPGRGTLPGWRPVEPSAPPGGAAASLPSAQDVALLPSARGQASSPPGEDVPATPPVQGSRSAPGPEPGVQQRPERAGSAAPVPAEPVRAVPAAAGQAPAGYAPTGYAPTAGAPTASALTGPAPADPMSPEPALADPAAQAPAPVRAPIPVVAPVPPPSAPAAARVRAPELEHVPGPAAADVATQHGADARQAGCNGQRAEARTAG